MKNIPQISTELTLEFVTDVLCQSKNQKSTADILILILQSISERETREDVHALIETLQKDLIEGFGRPFEAYRNYLLSGAKHGVDYYQTPEASNYVN